MNYITEFIRKIATNNKIMSNGKLIGSISEEKEKGLEAYKNAVIDGGTFDLLDKSTQAMVLTVISGAYTMGWVDCRYTCIKKLSELT